MARFCQLVIVQVSPDKSESVLADIRALNRDIRLKTSKRSLFFLIRAVFYVLLNAQSALIIIDS